MKLTYLQIAGLVGENILTGKWTAGRKILSVRDLAVELEVNPNTVMRSYELLQELQVVYKSAGAVVCYVAENGLEKAIAWRKTKLRAAKPAGILSRISFLLGILGLYGCPIICSGAIRAGTNSSASNYPAV